MRVSARAARRIVSESTLAAGSCAARHASSLALPSDVGVAVCTPRQQDNCWGSKRSGGVWRQQRAGMAMMQPKKKAGEGGPVMHVDPRLSDLLKRMALPDFTPPERTKEDLELGYKLGRRYNRWCQRRHNAQNKDMSTKMKHRYEALHALSDDPTLQAEVLVHKFETIEPLGRMRQIDSRPPIMGWHREQDDEEEEEEVDEEARASGRAKRVQRGAASQALFGEAVDLDEDEDEDMDAEALLKKRRAAARAKAKARAARRNKKRK